jgi:hypothetical protein
VVVPICRLERNDSDFTRRMKEGDDLTKDGAFIGVFEFDPADA